MAEEDIELCKRLQERTEILYRYCRLYPYVFPVVMEIAASLSLKERRIRGVK